MRPVPIGLLSEVLGRLSPTTLQSDLLLLELSITYLLQLLLHLVQERFYALLEIHRSPLALDDNPQANVRFSRGDHLRA